MWDSSHTHTYHTINQIEVSYPIPLPICDFIQFTLSDDKFIKPSRRLVTSMNYNDYRQFGIDFACSIIYILLNSHILGTKGPLGANYVKGYNPPQALLSSIPIPLTLMFTQSLSLLTFPFCTNPNISPKTLRGFQLNQHILVFSMKTSEVRTSFFFFKFIYTRQKFYSSLIYIYIYIYMCVCVCVCVCETPFWRLEL